MLMLLLVVSLVIAADGGMVTRKIFRSAPRPVVNRSAIDITESPSNPPNPTHPTNFLIMITQYCSSSMTLSSSSITSGSYVVPPPATIPPILKTIATTGMNAKADPTTGILNGTMEYMCSGCGQWPPGDPFFLGFFVEQGEWAFSVSFWSFLEAAFHQADVGPYSIYNIVLGRAQFSPEQQC